MKKLLHFTIFALLLVPAFTKAAEFSVVSGNKNLVPGEKFQVDIILNTQGESLNAFLGSIIFPKNLLELSEVRDGNSIISFWIEKPKIRLASSTDSETAVSFSGIVPGGYVGDKGLIASLVFNVVKSGSGNISIKDAEVLRNDGKGTSVKVSAKNFSFKSNDFGSVPAFASTTDNIPPESFTPSIASDPNLFDGKWFAVFATTDKGSGIDHYEVSEKSHGWLFDSAPDSSQWKVAESPYLLQDQLRATNFYVKAVDKNSNARIEVIHTIPWLRYTLFALLAIIALIATARYRRYRAKRAHS